MVARESTSVVPPDDPIAADAVRYIRAHACRGIGVVDVAAAIDVSRRTLELHLTRALGRTPREEIRRVQLERASHLLADTSLKIAAVATRSGFGHLQRLVAEFRKAHGMTPTAYRRQFRRDEEE